MSEQLQMEVVEVVTPSGSIYIEPSFTLGELTISILLVLLLLTHLLKWLISKVWD